MAKGADELGANWARQHGLTLHEFPAQWDKLDAPGAVVKQGPRGAYNALAGHQRNQQMADNATGVLLFEGGRGTADMARRAAVAGLDIYDYRIPSKPVFTPGRWTADFKGDEQGTLPLDAVTPPTENAMRAPNLMSTADIAALIDQAEQRRSGGAGPVSPRLVQPEPAAAYQREPNLRSTAEIAGLIDSFERSKAASAASGGPHRASPPPPRKIQGAYADPSMKPDDLRRYAHMYGKDFLETVTEVPLGGVLRALMENMEVDREMAQRIEQGVAGLLAAGVGGGGLLLAADALNGNDQPIIVRA